MQGHRFHSTPPVQVVGRQGSAGDAANRGSPAGTGGPAGEKKKDWLPVHLTSAEGVLVGCMLRRFGMRGNDTRVYGLGALRALDAYHERVGRVDPLGAVARAQVEAALAELGELDDTATPVATDPKSGRRRRHLNIPFDREADWLRVRDFLGAHGRRRPHQRGAAIAAVAVALVVTDDLAAEQWPTEWLDALWSVIVSGGRKRRSRR